uniref:Uncharacterized protein n=1 Tax=Picea glauca TaxID=3330 RepID=A0A117NFG0_PICGL|nr:hypothetical protein ABT39_MTgene3638 [Picea glauca]
MDVAKTLRKFGYREELLNVGPRRRIKYLYRLHLVLIYTQFLSLSLCVA